MSEKIVQLNEEAIKGQLKELVRGSVEETLNELLEAEAEKLTQLALSSFIPSAAPKTSRYPSSFTAIATRMATFSNSPPQFRRR